MLGSSQLGYATWFACTNRCESVRRQRLVARPDCVMQRNLHGCTTRWLHEENVKKKLARGTTTFPWRHVGQGGRWLADGADDVIGGGLFERRVLIGREVDDVVFKLILWLAESKLPVVTSSTTAKICKMSRGPSLPFDGTTTTQNSAIRSARYNLIYLT